MPFRIIVTEAPSEALLTLDGELDIAAVTQLRAAVHESLGRGAHRVVIDVSGVTFLDSAGLWELIFCRHLVDGARRVLIVTGHSAAVERLVRIIDRDWVTEMFFPDLVSD